MSMTPLSSKVFSVQPGCRAPAGAGKFGTAVRSRWALTHKEYETHEKPHRISRS